MITPKYWARAVVDNDGNEIQADWGYTGIGWSDISEADAHDQALKRAQRIYEWIVVKDWDEASEPGGQYYPTGVIREPVVNELHHDGQRIAIVTRNIYGAYVLNATEAMFIDIDNTPPPRQPGFLARLFGKKPYPDDVPSSEEKLRAVIERNPGLGIKAYRTPKGLRGLVTSSPFTPGSSQAESLLQSVDCDTTYILLCKAQQCFRARLTAKPYRIGMDNPPKTFPFTNPKKQQIFEYWNQSYESRCREYAACEPLSDEPWGNPVVHPEIAPVLAMHDELACSPGKPLA